MRRFVYVIALLGAACVEDPGAELDAAETEDLVVEEQAAALSPGCTELGSAINDHTCQHGQLGPFGSVTASSNPNFTTTTPRLDAVHKYFTVTLPSTGSGYAGTVKFTPPMSDDHAIYVHPSVTLSVRDKNGASLSTLLPGTVSGCPYLTSYKVYYLATSLAPFKIDLAAGTSAVNVIVESVSPAAVRWYQDADGDTWGAPSPSFLTACVPPAGYNVTRGGDCNNANASVYPGAPETPGDGIDSNCNGNDNT